MTTPITLTILYEAESTVDTTDGFLSDLEEALFSIALAAALECNGNARREMQEVTRKLTTSSSVVGTYTVLNLIIVELKTMILTVDFSLYRFLQCHGGC